MESKQDNAHGSSLRESPKKPSPASVRSAAESGTPGEVERTFDKRKHPSEDEADELVDRVTQGLVQFQRGRHWRRMAKRMAAIMFFLALLASGAYIVWQYAVPLPWVQYLLRFGISPLDP
jgi:hypothetical protein